MCSRVATIRTNGDITITSVLSQLTDFAQYFPSCLLRVCKWDFKWPPSLRSCFHLTWLRCMVFLLEPCVQSPFHRQGASSIHIFVVCTFLLVIGDYQLHLLKRKQGAGHCASAGFSDCQILFLSMWKNSVVLWKRILCSTLAVISLSLPDWIGSVCRAGICF